MSVNLTELFGLPGRKPDKNVSLAMLLRLLSDLIDGDETPQQEQGDGEREIPVRPRIEPLGGA